MKRVAVILLIILPSTMLGQIDSVKSFQIINNQVGGLSGNPLAYDDRFGIGVEVIGDVNQDGIDDIAVGAYTDDDGVTNQGAVYILMLNEDGTVKDQQKISATSGNGPDDFDASHLYFGVSVASLGDLNGDGNVDIAVGMHGGGDKATSGQYGAVYILFLDTNGTVLEYQKISNNEGGGTNQLAANDYFGISVSNIGDLNGDGLPDLAVGSTGSNDGGTDRGSVYIVNLDYNGTAKNIVEISDTQGGFTGVLDDNDKFGAAITTLGDLDGDDVIDIVVSAHTDDDGGTDKGAVWVLFMNNDGTVKSHQKISDTQGSFTGALDNYDYFGLGLVSLGDIDGDSITELAVGSQYDDDGVTDAGAFWILYLDTDGTVQDYDKISATDSSLSTVIDNNDRFARGISFFGDRNNDGKVDLLVGAWNGKDGVIGATGEVYVLHLDGNVSYPQKDYKTITSFITSIQKHSSANSPLDAELTSGDFYGFSCAGIGDLDGDGINDLAVGAMSDDDGGANRGAVYIQFLNADGSIKSYQKISDTQGGFTGTLNDADRFGCSVSSLDDLDGNGVIDIVVGAYGDDDGGTGRGALWILFMDTNGTVKSHQKISDTQGGFTGTLNNADRFGISVTGIDDIDGDGVRDIVVGARYDNGGGSDKGAVWVLFMDTDGTVQDYQKINANEGNLSATLDFGDMFGTSVTSIGDLDDDGVPDIAVGAYADDDGDVNTGAVYIINLTDSGTVKSEQKISMSSGGFEGFIDEGDFSGASICGNYDFNQDGVNDLLVGAIQNDNGGTNRGLCWMLLMNSDGTVQYHKTISSTSNQLTTMIDNSDFIGRSIGVVNFNIENNTAKIVLGVNGDDDGSTNAGAVYIVDIDLSVLQDYTNNIFIDTRSFSEAIPYSLELEGAIYSYTTGGIEFTLITDTSNIDTAIVTVEATSSYGALELLFDVDGTQISNVRIITDSLGGGDTLALDSNLYTISSNGQMLTLYERDTNDISTDSLLYGFELQGGLGFSPDEDGDYDELVITGLENIFYFNLTIKDLDNTTVFYTEDKSDFWNGKYMGTGSLMNRGAYQYTLNVNGETLEGQILLDY